MTSPLRRRQQSTTPLHHRPLPQLLLDVPELAVVRLPSELTRSPSRSPSRSPRPDFNRRDTFKRAATYSTFEASKRGWAQIVEHHILRKPVRVTALFGEKPGLLESELGPHATVARWARLNRARPWPLRLLHPNSVERRAIDATTSLLVTLSVLQVPLQAIFAWWPYLRLSATGFAAFNFAMRAWFVIELFLNLRTGYIRRDGTLVMDGPTIFKKHVFSGWLLLDILGVMPVERFGAFAIDLLPKPPGMETLKLSRRERAMRRASLYFDRLGRFALRAIRGQLRLRRPGGAEAGAASFHWSALSYRCKRGTADTALFYCEWHETSYEMVWNIYSLSRQMHVPRLLKSAHALGYFWQALRYGVRLAVWMDVVTKVLFLTKWGQVRRLLTLTHFWRIGVRWLRVRKASALSTLEGMRRSVSRSNLAGLCRAVSRHAGLDQLGAEGGFAPVFASIGRRVSSFPARLSELIAPCPLADAPSSSSSSSSPSEHEEHRARQLRRFASDEALLGHGGCLLDPFENPPKSPARQARAGRNGGLHSWRQPPVPPPVPEHGLGDVDVPKVFALEDIVPADDSGDDFDLEDAAAEPDSQTTTLLPLETRAL